MIALDGGANASLPCEQQFGRKLTPADPAFGINWFEAVTYCRWLTAQTGHGGNRSVL